MTQHAVSTPLPDGGRRVYVSSLMRRVAASMVASGETRTDIVQAAEYGYYDEEPESE